MRFGERVPACGRERGFRQRHQSIAGSGDADEGRDIGGQGAHRPLNLAYELDKCHHRTKGDDAYRHAIYAPEKCSKVADGKCQIDEQRGIGTVACVTTRK